MPGSDKATGSIQLKHSWKETADRFNPEITTTLTLEASADGQTLRLIDRTTITVLAKGESEEKFHEISVEKLVKLIRKHGTPST
ncbi:MAG: hypothetical protein J0H86_23835 [Xanthomonadaceae bacterium]|nr:hypothetical protein [Xanthomonadaceae bacterium]